MNFKADIQRISDYKDNVVRRLYAVIEACDAIENNGKAFDLLDICGKKMGEYADFFKNLIIETGITVDSSYEEQYAFWRKVESKYRQLDMWLTKFCQDNGIKPQEN